MLIHGVIGSIPLLVDYIILNQLKRKKNDVHQYVVEQRLLHHGGQTN